MPEGKRKSRTARRVFRRTPTGESRLYYVKRKPSKAHCSQCGAVLSGVPRERPFKMMRMAKTKKRPERPFGGNLCSRCMRIRVIENARKGA